jgi:hypothetical protein
MSWCQYTTKPGHVPAQVESYFGNVNCIGERSCYDEGKRAAETLTFDYMREHGLEVCQWLWRTMSPVAASPP